MSRATLSLSGRHLQGLLTAFVKRKFVSNTAELEESFAFTNEALMSQLNCSDETEIIIMEKALNVACLNMWSDSALRGYLTSVPATSGSTAEAVEEVDPIELVLSEEQVSAFIKFWQDNKEKIRAKLLQKSAWNKQYKGLHWRIDLRTLNSDQNVGENTEADANQEANEASLNEPLAFFEMETRPGHRSGNNDTTTTTTTTSSDSTVRFQMNHHEIKELGNTFDDIKRAIEQTS